MIEHPILFSGAMVRAILDGSKSVTRRVVKLPYPSCFGAVETHAEYPGEWFQWAEGQPSETFTCPYGAVGDRLWVRETCAFDAESQWEPGGPGYWYRANYTDKEAAELKEDNESCGIPFRWTPAIHMKRKASRITLDVTGVTVERLQDITEEQAKAEGVSPLECVGADQQILDTTRGRTHGTHPHVLAFAVLWDTINDKRRGCAWKDNPWVWVVSFRVIDALGRRS